MGTAESAAGASQGTATPSASGPGRTPSGSAAPGASGAVSGPPPAPSGSAAAPPAPSGSGPASAEQAAKTAQTASQTSGATGPAAGAAGAGRPSNAGAGSGAAATPAQGSASGAAATAPTTAATAAGASATTPATTPPAPSAPASAVTVSTNATAQSGGATAQGIVSSTTVHTQQNATVSQGAGSTGNQVNLAVNVQVTNRGTATANSGATTAAATDGATTFSTTVTTTANAAAAPSGAVGSSAAGPATSATVAGTSTTATTATPGAASASPIVVSSPAPGVQVTTSNGAVATSGGATAVGVVANTRVVGDQAVVVHIPANTSAQVVTIGLNVDVSNTGAAYSRSGDVSATGLQGDTAIGINAAPPVTANAANTVAITTGPITPGLPTGAGKSAAPQVDVRSTNYAIANSGDAMAIGVKAETVARFLQRVTVTIDDNSSGNRIQLVFHVAVANVGQAEAISGAVSALGQVGNLGIALGGAGGLGSQQVMLSNSGTATSGDASATGVLARTLVQGRQDVTLLVGKNSSNNLVDVVFDFSLLNQGDARATSGAALARGMVGNTTVSTQATSASVTASTQAGTDPSVAPSAGVSVNLSTLARGRSGNASSLGLNASTRLNESQAVNLDLVDFTEGPISVQSGDKVINVGLARSVTGAVTVVAQIVPPPSAPPSPVAATTAIGPATAAAVAVAGPGNAGLKSVGSEEGGGGLASFTVLGPAGLPVADPGSINVSSVASMACCGDSSRVVPLEGHPAQSVPGGAATLTAASRSAAVGPLSPLPREPHSPAAGGGSWAQAGVSLSDGVAAGGPGEGAGARGVAAPADALPRLLAFSWHRDAIEPTPLARQGAPAGSPTTVDAQSRPGRAPLRNVHEGAPGTWLTGAALLLGALLSGLTGAHLRPWRRRTEV